MSFSIQQKSHPDFLNQPIHIYWFSGGGNSLVIALEIRDFLIKSGCRVTLLPLDRSDPSKVDTSALIGFVVPVAGQGTYPFVWEFISHLSASANRTPCFFVDTLGLYSGGVLGPVKSLLKKKGYRPIAAREIFMPNIFMKKVSRPEQEHALIEKGKIKARIFCSRLLEGKGRWWDIPVYSWLISLFYRSRKAVSLWKKLMRLTIDESVCTKCGICVGLCPEKALTQAGKTVPEIGDGCTLCQRCLLYCPAHAFRINGKEQARYQAVPLKTILDNLKSPD